MRRTGGLFTGLILSALSTAQIPPIIDWQHSYGGSQIESSRNMIPSTDGGYVIASITYSTDGDLAQNTEGREIWLMKLNGQGELQWQNWYGSIYTTSSKLKVRETPDGGFIVVTTVGIDALGVGCAVNDIQGWIFKVDDDGEMEWEHCMGGSNSDGFSSVELTADDGYIVCGGSHSSDGDLSENNGLGDMWVLKLTGTGSIVWSKNYGGTGNEGASHAIQTSDGGFLIGGGGRSNDLLFEGCNPYSPFNNTTFILKLDADGNVVWHKCYGGNDQDVLNKIMEGENGTFWIAGTTESTDGNITGHHGAVDAWVLKLDSDGELIDNQVFGGSSNDFFDDFQLLNDNNIFIIGHTHSTDGDVEMNLGLNDVWLVLLNENLDLVWQKTYGGSNHDHGYGISIAHDGGAVFCGSSYSTDGDLTENNGSADAWIVKLKPWDDTSVEAIDTSSSLTVYPNPANDLLYLELDGLIVGNPLAIEVYDPLGRLALSETFNSPKGRLEIPLQQLAMGTYQIRTVVAGKAQYAHFIKL